MWHDDGVYLLVAKSLAAGEGLGYAGISGTPPAPKFPPLYPAVLAAIWRWGPQFPDSGVWMAAANSLFTAAAAAGLALLLWKGCRLRPGWAVASSAVLFLSPELWRLAAVPLSEPLFTALFLFACWAGTRFESSGRLRDAGLFLVLFWAAYHTRTIGVVLLPAVVWAAWWRGWTGEAVGVGLVGATGVLPWPWVARGMAAEIPVPALDTLGPYGGWLIDQVRTHPRKYLDYLGSHARDVLADLSELILPGLPSTVAVWTGLGLLFLVGLAGWSFRARSRVLPWSLLLYGLVVWLWPFHARRLLVPALPLLAALVLGAFRTSGTEPHSAPSLPAGLRRAGAVAGAAWAVWFIVASATALYESRHLDAYRVRAEALQAAARSVAEHTPTDAVVGAPEMFAGLHLYTGRTVWPSARFLPLAELGPSWGTERQQYELWRDGRISHLLVEHGGGVHGSALDRMDAVCPDGGVGVLDFLPGSFLVQLGWTDACYGRLTAGTAGL